MSEKAKGSSGCWKVGCLGCAGAIVVLVGIPMLLFGIAAMQASRPGEFERESLSRELPAVEVDEETASAIRLGEVDPRELPGLVGAQEPVLVELELSGGRFTVDRADPGEPLSVEADYDKSRWELLEDWDAERRRYRVRFRNRGALSWFTQGGDNRVRIRLPMGTPILLKGEISLGESDLELGGLWLTGATFDLGMGSHRVAFSEPTVGAFDRFEANGSMGELDIVDLGNASPARVEIEHSMGEVTLDLRGEWRNDATVRVEGGMGQSTIRAPRTARLVVERSSVSMGEKSIDEARVDDLPEDAPTITLSASTSMGQLTIDR